MIFDRAQLRERYTVSSSLIDRVDGGRSRSDEVRERIMEALTLLGGSMGLVALDVIGSELSL
jgi:isoaspartyl peptidase/L-asparaginase-like protein (Ntn-hydrolase superfamily)